MRYVWRPNAQAQLRASHTIASEVSFRKSPIGCSDTLGDTRRYRSPANREAGRISAARVFVRNIGMTQSLPAR